MHISSTQLYHTSLYGLSVNERIRVGVKSLTAIHCLLACSAKFTPAFSLQPRMLCSFEPDVSGITGKAFGDRVGAVSVLRTIKAAPRQQTGEIRRADAVHLFGKDMI